MRTHGSREFARGHRFLEAPRWHDGSLWASDFFTGKVLRFDGNGAHQSVAEIPGRPSGLGFLADGSMVAVSQEMRKVLRVVPTGQVREYADFAHLATGPGNDLHVSADGHAYVGNFGFELGREPGPASLVHVDPAGAVRRVPGDLMFPNGIGLRDSRTLLVAETLAHRISAFDVQADGAPVNPRIWAQLGEAFHPDGIAVDSDGGVWFGNALAEGPASGFYRVVEGGEITDWIPVAGAWAVACAFGGPDLDRLFLACSSTTRDAFREGRSTSYAAVASVGRTGVKPVAAAVNA